MQARQTKPSPGLMRRRRTGVAAPPVVHAVPVSVRLSPVVAVDVDLVAAIGGARALSVRVEFPDEARSALETVTWPSGTTLVDTVASLGVRLVREYPAALLVRAGRPDRYGRGNGTPSVLSLPFATFRSWLEQALGSDLPVSEGRGAPKDPKAA